MFKIGHLKNHSLLKKIKKIIHYFFQYHDVWDKASFNQINNSSEKAASTIFGKY